jgi:hypothetical protein
MTTPAVTLTCTGAELYYLGAALGGTTLLGVRDPFPGWLTEEIVEAMPAAQAALAQRGYLSSQIDGTSVMSEPVAALLQAAIAPVSSFIGNMTLAEDMIEQRAFHLAGAMAVEIALQPPDSYHLTALKGPDGIEQQLDAWWAIGAQSAAPSSAANMPESALVEASKQARQAGAAAASTALVEAGVPHLVAEVLSATLASPRLNAALVALRPGMHAVSSVAFLDGGPGMWRLRAFERDDQPWVEAIPCSGAEIREQVVQLIARFAAA